MNFGVDHPFGSSVSASSVFLIRLLEDLAACGHIKPIGPGDESALARIFVVLHSLRRGEERNVQRGRALISFMLSWPSFTSPSIAFHNGLWSLIKEAEYLFQSFELSLRLRLSKATLKCGDWAAFAIEEALS